MLRQILAFGFSLFCAGAFAQIEDPERVFRELRAMEGTWFMPTDRGDRLEIWRFVDDSTMAGRGLRIKPENGDTVNLETLRLELRGDKITYYAIARGQNKNQPVPFELTSADIDGYLFENPAHDDPKKIRYLLLSNREIQVFTEGERNGRPSRQEFVFEREFNPSSVEVRARFGLNMHRLHATGQFLADTLGKAQDLGFGPKPGFEFGAGASFNGRGGYLRVNVGLDVIGRYSAVNSDYLGDTAVVVRNGTYNTFWFGLSVLPEFRLKREGGFSILVGPYAGLQMSSSLRGEARPDRGNKDFKRFEVGLMFGFQQKLNLLKKDLDGILGLRGSLGLKDLDKLYNRDCDNPAFCNGQVKWQGVSLYYSINLTKL